MDRWLRAALDYIPSWLEYQVHRWQQPGCVIAVAHRGKVVLEKSFGQASLATGAAFTPRHRFRIASHSKSFTAAGILKLREQGRLKLDDTVGTYVKALHPAIARATLSQLLSHSAGIVRDGTDAGQFVESKPFADTEELLHDLAQCRPSSMPGTRLQIFQPWLWPARPGHRRRCGRALSRLDQARDRRSCRPEGDAARHAASRGTPFARGHSSIMPLGRRLVIPGDYSTNAIGPAGGFVSTAADTALFFNQLSPGAAKSVLSVASRREMMRRQWRNPHASLEGYYGLGTMSGTIGGWDWFGHSGGLLGYISRTVTVPAHDLTVSVMSNAADGWPGAWVDGAVNILRTFAQNGAPSRRAAGWKGRWWLAWGPCDLVPMGDKVVTGVPAWVNPFLDSTEIELTSRDTGRVALANGYASHGEPVRRVRTANGRIREIWMGGGRLVSERNSMSELERRFGAKAAKRRRPGPRK